MFAAPSETNRQCSPALHNLEAIGEYAPMETTDHELMIAVREGDIDLLGELFERHHRPLFGFILRSTNNRAASEDLVQTVFMRILKYRHTYRDEGNFRTWMYHLSRTCLADYHRKNNAAPFSLADQAKMQQVADKTPSAASHAESSDNLSILERALQSLSPEQRELIVLHRFQHLSHQELATLHDCSLSAIKVRVHRALNSLKTRFHQLYHSPSGQS